MHPGNVGCVVPLDGRPGLPRKIGQWLGSSRGHWEGDTLVLDSISFVDSTWLGRGGLFHSEKMHIIERFNRSFREEVLNAHLFNSISEVQQEPYPLDAKLYWSVVDIFNDVIYVPELGNRQYRLKLIGKKKFILNSLF